MSTIVILFAVALVLFFFEILVPGGVLAIMGALLMVTACVVAGMEYGALGAGLTGVLALVIGVGMFFLEIKLLPKLPFAAKAFHTDSLADAVTGVQETAPDIVGKRGEALTTLAPTGTVVVDGTDYEAFSRSGLVEKGTPVEVVSTDNFRIIVRTI